MGWHGTQCCVHAGIGEMGALQWHHPQSHSPFSMTCSMCSVGKTCQHWQTDRARNNTLAVIHTRVYLKGKWRVDGLTLTTVDETSLIIHFHTIQSKPTLFLSLLTLTQHALARGCSVIVLSLSLSLSLSLLRDCVVGTLSVGTLTEALVTWNDWSSFFTGKRVMELWLLCLCLSVSLFIIILQACYDKCPMILSLFSFLYRLYHYL